MVWTLHRFVILTRSWRLQTGLLLLLIQTLIRNLSRLYLLRQPLLRIIKRGIRYHCRDQPLVLLPIILRMIPLPHRLNRSDLELPLPKWERRHWSGRLTAQFSRFWHFSDWRGPSWAAATKQTHHWFSLFKLFESCEKVRKTLNRVFYRFSANIDKFLIFRKILLFKCRYSLLWGGKGA